MIRLGIERVVVRVVSCCVFRTMSATPLTGVAGGVDRLDAGCRARLGGCGTLVLRALLALAGACKVERRSLRSLIEAKQASIEGLYKTEESMELSF